MRIKTTNWNNLALAGALLVIATAPAVLAQGLQLEAAVDPWTPDPLGDLLYDQTDSPLGGAFVSQRFAPVDAAFDCRAADDFTVPAGDIQWDVASAQVPGAYFPGTGPTPLIDVEFFGDAGGLPDAVAVCSYIGLVAGVDFLDVNGDLSVTLPAPCSLVAGDYWLSVRAELDQAVGGQWIWEMRSAQNGAMFAWENPGDGFATGCTSWTSAGSCGASGPDVLFSLSGVSVPVELQSIHID